MKHTWFITGADTGVGKTVLTVLLTGYLRRRGANVVALKPICSGGRDDARALYTALDETVPLDKINPWHFREPIAPVLAARREHKSVALADVLAKIRAMQKRFDPVLVEGAGGLLSPLGADFNSRDLLTRLRAAPIVVAVNRIGVVNQILLTLEALPKNSRALARVVLMPPRESDDATSTNAKLLAEFTNPKRIYQLPWLGDKFEAKPALQNSRARGTLDDLVQGLKFAYAR